MIPHDSLIDSRVRKIRECFFLTESWDGISISTDNNRLVAALREFAECDWDAGRDVKLEEQQNGTEIQRVMLHVALERVRQNGLREQGKFAYTCADAGLSNAERFMVLAEEFGEVGHELNEGLGEGRSVSLERLRTELVQVAAVCVAWCEAIDGGRVER